MCDIIRHIRKYLLGIAELSGYIFLSVLLRAANYICKFVAVFLKQIPVSKSSPISSSNYLILHSYLYSHLASFG